MSLLCCLKCATKFAVGLLHCPHCLSEDFEEADVPKITVSGGASHPEDLAAVSGLALPPVTPAEPEVAPEPEPAPPPKPVPSLSGSKSAVVQVSGDDTAAAADEEK